jgi:tetratricopeptide (TPR) repeat protein
LAVRAYERTLKDGPLTAAAYNNLGLAYQDLGRLEAAETALERAVELGLENSAAAINLQMLRLRRSGRDALAIYEAMTLDYPYRPELWRGLAAAYAAKGRLAEAIAACRRIIALDPRDQQAIANLEKLLKNQRGD